MNKINEDFYQRFKCKAEELTVKVLRAPSAEDVVTLITAEIGERNIRNVVSTPLALVDTAKLEDSLRASEIDLCRELDLEKIERAGMGISEFQLGIAELGSLFQDASGLHKRLVSMLPPVHLALLRTSSLVETFAHALEAIEKMYNGQIPPYLSFITGPSKTADIERELTIGVHGPETLIILCID